MLTMKQERAGPHRTGQHRTGHDTTTLTTFSVGFAALFCVRVSQEVMSTARAVGSITRLASQVLVSSLAVFVHGLLFSFGYMMNEALWNIKLSGRRSEIRMGMWH